MIQLKTELQIKYHSITDMSKHIRTIVSPYTLFATNIQFDNINHPGELAKINFVEENVMLIIDWNQIVGITIGKTQGLENRSERFHNLFELYEKVEKLPTFNNVDYIRLRTFDVLEDKFSNLEQFKSTFLNSNKLFEKLDVNDTGLIIDGSKDEIDYSVTFGPFKKDKDISNYDLRLYGQNATEKEDISGCLVLTQLTLKKSKFNNELIKDMFSLKRNIIKLIDESS